MDKLVYQQGDVFVHTAVPGSTLYDDIIRGTLSIYQNTEGTFMEWSPSTTFTPVAHEVHPVYSGSFEYGNVTTQEPQPMNNNTNIPPEDQPPHNSYKIHFNVESVHSIRRSDPRLAWSYVLFNMKDGTSQPALHFHSGGIKDMISMLQRYIWLTRSPANQRLFVVKEKDDAMESALNQFELFSDKPSGAISKLFNSTFYDTLSSFSKVTNYVMSGMGQLDLQERRPERRRAADNEQNNDDEFEFLHPDVLEQPEAVIPVARAEPLSPEEWCSFIDDNGKIANVTQLREKIFRGGVHRDIRCEAWKYLLGYHKFDSNYEERTKRVEKLRKDYERMKLQWESISKEQETRFADFAQRKHAVEKDTHRTDRKSQFFAGDDNPNVKKLFNILMTYCMFNFDLGYVQGMSDLLAPILRLLEDEVDTFWCFVGFMEMEERLFEISQDHMKTQLEDLGKLIKFLYPNFWGYLENHEAHNLYFCFRWLLISFKREFENNDVMTLWEALWTQSCSLNFKLFICCAILENEKDEMMKKNYDFNDILKHINKLSGRLDVKFVLSRAESICLQLKQTENLPDDIKLMLNHPIVEAIQTQPVSLSRQNEAVALDYSVIEDNEDQQRLQDLSSAPQYSVANADGQSHQDIGDRNVHQDVSDRDAHSFRPEDVVELVAETQSVFL